MRTSLSQSNSNIYFDNAATSYPKPPEVVEAVAKYMSEVGANPGRSAYPNAISAGEVLFKARQLVAKLFNLKNPMRVAFSANATESLNLAIQGVLENGDRAVTTNMEHNSTIRVLNHLGETRGVKVEIVGEEIVQALVPGVKACVVNHGSNISGTVAPIEKIGKICRDQGIIFIVDCAQSAGTIDIDIKRDNIDLLAFTGHKGLLGPMGTGGLVISDDFDESRLTPLKFGGTGSLSDKTVQPTFLPDSLESGSLNVAGLSGLIEGISFLNRKGIDSIYRHKRKLVERFYKNAPVCVEFYIEEDKIETGTISFNVKGLDASSVAMRLSDQFGIMCRPGLHCAPLAHLTVGTFPAGSVRFSFGPYNSEQEVDAALEALEQIGREG